MRPKKRWTTGEGDLFRARLDQIINLKHELVQLPGKIGTGIGSIARSRRSAATKARPGSRRASLSLAQAHLRLIRPCERWVYDPYFQHFTGEEFFQHEFPHERSDLNHWRKRLGPKLELLLAESLRIAHEAGALRSSG